jgi:hypothetical protein
VHHFSIGIGAGATAGALETGVVTASSSVIGDFAQPRVNDSLGLAYSVSAIGVRLRLNPDGTGRVDIPASTTSGAFAAENIAAQGLENLESHGLLDAASISLGLVSPDNLFGQLTVPGSVSPSRPWTGRTPRALVREGWDRCVCLHSSASAMASAGLSVSPSSSRNTSSRLRTAPSLAGGRRSMRAWAYWRSCWRVSSMFSL